MSKKISLKQDIKKNLPLYLLVLPVIIYFLIFNYLPMTGIFMAFEDYTPVKGIFHSKFVGFKNFIRFFTAPNFFQILRNTLVISLLGLGIGFPLTIGFALLLNEITNTAFKKVVQTMSYIPYFVSMVIICGLIIDFVSSNGIISNLLVALGFKRQNLLLNPKYFWAIYIISDLWQGLGYGSIVFIAAISGINPELYEAAVIDGCGRWRRMWNITLPSIMPTVVTMFVLKCGMLMTVGFDKILLLYNPSIYSTADVIATHVQRMGLEKMQYGYSAAVGLFNSIVGTILLLVSNKMSKKLTDHEVL